jgi:hypothetical protein
VFLDQLDDRLGQKGMSLRPAAARLRQQVAATRDAIQRTEVGRERGSDYQPYPGFLSYSVWLPADAGDYHRRAATYVPSAFYQYGRGGSPGPWQGFLDKLYGAAPVH